MYGVCHVCRHDGGMCVVFAVVCRHEGGMYVVFAVVCRHDGGMYVVFAVVCRDLSQDEEFVDELRTNIRFLGSVLLRRMKKVGQGFRPFRLCVNY